MPAGHSGFDHYARSCPCSSDRNKGDPDRARDKTANTFRNKNNRLGQTPANINPSKQSEGGERGLGGTRRVFEVGDFFTTYLC